MDQVEACQLVYRGPVFLVLDLDAFGITMPHRRGSPATLQLYQDTVTYSRLPFSCMGIPSFSRLRFSVRIYYHLSLYLSLILVVQPTTRN
jgi:hypothetical protein